MSLGSRYGSSDETDYINGAILYVDGGMALYPAFREGG